MIMSSLSYSSPPPSPNKSNNNNNVKRSHGSSRQSPIVHFGSGFLAGITMLSMRTMLEDHSCILVAQSGRSMEALVKQTLPMSTSGDEFNISAYNKNVTGETTRTTTTTTPATTPPAPAPIMPIFPESMSHLVAGMARVQRKQFAQQFDIGYGVDPGFEYNREVLLLYGSKESLPTSVEAVKSSSSSSQQVFGFQELSAAVENCDVVKVVLTDPKPPTRTRGNKNAPPHRQCIAIMGQWESSHVHKWRRTKTAEFKNNKIEFEYAASHHSQTVPSVEETAVSNKNLLEYLSAFSDAQQRLQPLAEKAARGLDGKVGPILVMVANFGQSQFFLNFCCSARARGLDISRLLLLATDQETHDLALAMNVTSFYDSRIFAGIPLEAAVNYKDLNYGRIMMSKVYCVHLINSLKYDLLYQDVDVVWYKDPLPYFANKDKDNNSIFDMYFQHDGSHHPVRFAPLAANTGFYFVRYNERTEYFFSVFVRMGDLVLYDRSHQAAFTTLANEHMNLRGLRVKVLADDHDLFLSGYHHHAAPRLIKQTMNGKHRPYLFHVNWMEGKDKQRTLQASNNWFVAKNCTGKQKSAELMAELGDNAYEACCLARPLPGNHIKVLA